MKFNINFDETIYSQQLDLLFDGAYKGKVNYNKNSQYLGIVLVLTGVAFIYDRNSFFGYLLLFTGSVFIIQYIHLYYKITSLSKKLEKEKQVICEKFRGSLITIEFTEEAFVLNDTIYETRVEWKEFKGIFLREETLFMITKEFNPYIIGKVEVGKEHFDKITEFIKTKMNSKTESNLGKPKK